MCSGSADSNSSKTAAVAEKSGDALKSPVHTGNKVDRIGNKVERIRQQSTLLPVCCRFPQPSTFNKVDRVEFNFVASVYRA